MCGRFTLAAAAETVAMEFQLTSAPGLVPRYNIAPSQPIAVVRLDERGLRVLVMLHWGLIPSWAREAKVGYRMINARMETLESKPAFREAFHWRRCIVPADGFYEWKPQGKTKQPYHVRLRGGGCFGMASLWERWRSADGEEIQSCTIITTEANSLVRDLHDRMPAILSPENYRSWLDPATDPLRLKSHLLPLPPERMEAYPVSTAVNRPDSEGAELLRPSSPS